MTRHLFCIDPQLDFTAPKGMFLQLLEGGTLYVPNSEFNIARTAYMLEDNPESFDKITVTMDTHHPRHIAHAMNWIDKNGNHPEVKTVITPELVANGTWRATDASRQKVFERYVISLAKEGRYILVIWPEHCLLGSIGWSVNPVLFAALNKWVHTQDKEINYVLKGYNNDTENYSAICAAVMYPDAPETFVNYDLLDDLEADDEIVVTGEALNFCVASTVKDMATYFKNPDTIKKVTLLEDATSPISGFEHLTEAFLKDMKEREMKIGRTTDYLKGVK